MRLRWLPQGALVDPSLQQRITWDYKAWPSPFNISFIASTVWCAHANSRLVGHFHTSPLSGFKKRIICAVAAPSLLAKVTTQVHALKSLSKRFNLDSLH